MLRTSKNIPIVLLLSLIMPSCDILDPPIPQEPAFILFTVSGGIAGGVHTKLSISPTDFARLESTYPVLERQLSDQERRTLVETFSGFKFLREDFPALCIDDFFYTIQRVGEDYSKRVVISGCALGDKTNLDPFLKKIRSIVSLLGSLAKNIYDTQAPWIGLTADYSIDAGVYGLGEPVRLTYRVSNPTGIERGLYFKNQSQLWFSVYKPNIPSFYYSFPNPFVADSSMPSEIILQPRETKELIYEWDQTVTSPQGQKTRLDIGSYRIVMNFLAGFLPSQAFSFEVVDRSIPIGGVIIPDWNGDGSNSPTYTFTLSIHNWTSNTVVLHFPNSQKIFVQLYNLGSTQPGPLIYEGPKERDSVPGEIVLAPGQEIIFQHVAAKELFQNWYMWTYAKITLLSSDFEFSRDAQLRISRF